MLGTVVEGALLYVCEHGSRKPGPRTGSHAKPYPKYVPNSAILTRSNLL